MPRFSLSAIGKDRPGIVSAVTELLYKNRCNIEDSNMTILEGEFAMIMIVGAPDELKAEKLQSQCATVEKKLGLHVHCKELERPAEAKATSQETRPYMISLLGADQPGLIYRVSSLLAKKGVNITDVNTKVMGTSEQPTYAMLVEADVPIACSLEKLKEELSKLEAELKAEITIKPVDVLPL